MRKKSHPQGKPPDRQKEKLRLALKGAEQQDMVTTFLLMSIAASCVFPFGLHELIHFHNGWEIATNIFQNGLSSSAARSAVVINSVVLILLLLPLLAPFVHRAYTSCQAHTIYTENLTRAEIYKIANSSVNRHLAIPKSIELLPKSTSTIEYFIVKTESDPDVITYFVLRIGDWSQPLPYRPPIFSLFGEMWGYGGLIHSMLFMILLEMVNPPYTGILPLSTISIVVSRALSNDSLIDVALGIYIFGLGILQTVCSSYVIIGWVRWFLRPKIDEEDNPNPLIVDDKD